MLCVRVCVSSFVNKMQSGSQVSKTTADNGVKEGGEKMRAHNWKAYRKFIAIALCLLC